MSSDHQEWAGVAFIVTKGEHYPGTVHVMTYVLCPPYWAIGVLGFSWVSATLDKASIFLSIGFFPFEIVIITPPLTEAVSTQCLAQDLACSGPALGMFSYTKLRSHPWAAG